MNRNDQQQWDLIISPKKNLFNLNLKEVWHYRDLIYLFVRRDFVAKYKQTILGPLWFVIQPLLTTLMFTVVFGKIAKIPTDGLPHILFYMSGIVAWNYFANCLNGTSNTFISNAGIFGKVYFPRLVTPISIVISNLLQFFIQFIFLLGFMLFYYLKGASFQITWAVALLPLLVLMLAGLGLGFGILISSMTTKYRDLTNLVRFGVQLWMYITPIVYPLSELPEKYRIFIILNPVTPIIEAFRYALLGKGTVEAWHLAYSAAFTVILLVFSIAIFNKVEKSFIDTV